MTGKSIVVFHPDVEFRDASVITDEKASRPYLLAA
jgi:hypothetical protein